MKAYFHIALRHLHCLGSFTQTQPFVIGKGQQHPIPLSQFCQGILNDDSSPDWIIHLAVEFFNLIKRQRGYILVSAIMVTHEVPRDRAEPGTEMLAALYLSHIHECPDKSILREILTHMIIVGHSQDDSKYQPLVNGDEPRHCLLITILCTFYQTTNIIDI